MLVIELMHATKQMPQTYLVGAGYRKGTEAGHIAGCHNGGCHKAGCRIVPSAVALHSFEGVAVDSTAVDCKL